MNVRSLVKILLFAVLIFSVPAMLVLAQTAPPPPMPTPFPSPTYPPISPTWTPTPFSPTFVPTTTPVGFVPSVPVGYDTTIAFGELVPGSISAGVPSARYRFQAEAGQTIALTYTVNGGYYLNIYVQDVNGNYVGELARTNNSIIYSIPVSAEYSININWDQYGYGGIPSLDYTLLLESPEPDVIEYGEQVEDSMSDSETLKVYEFRGQAGDQIYVQAQSTLFQPLLFLYGIEGYQLTSSQYNYYYTTGGQADIGLYTLPQTGNYRIQLLPQYAGVGIPSGDFSLSLMRIEPEVLTFGDPVEGEFTAENSVMYYVFDGKYGDVVDLRVEAEEDLDTVISLFSVVENYQLMFDDDSGSGYDPEILRQVLNVDGQYVVRVQPFYVGDTGTFMLYTARNGANSLDDGVQTIRLGKRPNEILTFTADAGEAVTLKVHVISGSMPYINLSQVGQMQPLLMVNSVELKDVSVDFMVPVEGAVRVQIDQYNPGYYMGATIVELEIVRGE